MTINEKIVLERNRHVKQIEEIKAGLKNEYDLYEKNMYELRKEKALEQLSKIDIELHELEKADTVDFAEVQPIPLKQMPFDDRLKMTEEERTKVNQQLENIVTHNNQEIDTQNKTVENFNATPREEVVNFVTPNNSETINSEFLGKTLRR